jgi:hypothetical protein
MSRRGITAQGLKDMVPGIQLAIFETVWGVFTGLREVLIRRSEDGLEVFCRFKTPPSTSTKADCKRLLREVLDVAFDNASSSFKFGTSVPRKPYDQLMSQRVFTAIAKEVAPWRLKAGR